MNLTNFEVNDNAEYLNDMEIGEEIISNRSELPYSAWSYSNISPTTEQWVEDVFMGDPGGFTTEEPDTTDKTFRSYSHVGSFRKTSFSFCPPSPSALEVLRCPSTNADESSSVPCKRTKLSGFRLYEEQIYDPASGHQSEVAMSSDEPWDPLGHPRVRQYESGYVAFMDSPESSMDQSCLDAPYALDASRQDNATCALWDTRLDKNPPKDSPISHPNKQLKWEVKNVAALEPPCNGLYACKDAQGNQKRGRRGPLDPKKARNASIMRRVGSCWPCRVTKLRCSLGNPCENCRDEPFPSPLAYGVCCRNGFANYEHLYFPEVLTYHLNHTEVKLLITENVETFLDPGRVVQVHCGRSFPPMELTVHFFKPKTDSQLLNHFHLQGSGENGALELIPRPCVPVGILGVDIEALKKNCMSYIRSMVSHPDYPKQATTIAPLGIYHRILEVIHKFSNAEKDCLLDKAMQLHAMHHFMKKIITFTEDSASIVTTIAKNYLGLKISSHDISSRLLNRQIKYAMCILERRQTRILLEDFERHLKKREQTGWPISFCVVIILCLHIEEIQMTINNFIVNDAQVSQKLRGASYDVCAELEEKPYYQYTQLFHDMYRSYKQPNDHASGGFNPVTGEICQNTQWSQAAQEMLRDIRQIICDSQDEMRAISAISFSSDQDHSDHNGLVKARGTRLLSKFLRSFLDGI